MPELEIHPAAGEKRPLGIYLHIPFCKRKCLYCDFLSAPAPERMIARYVDALCVQLAAEAAAYEGFYVRTVFWGGGTPSLLSASQVETVMAQIRGHYGLLREAEITMECNPGTLDMQKLKGYRKAGINRLSLGLQSACDAELKALGRIHSYGDFLKNYEAARQAGFANINVDLMSALPGQSAEGWLDTLCKVAELSPEHISAYSLIIEEGTPFYERYGDGESGEGMPDLLPLPAEEEERRMYEETEKTLRRYGYHRYEISNYAKPGKECLHNIGYWERTDYAGFGLGAASLAGNARWKMTDDLEEYLRIFDAGGCRTAGTGAGREAADGEAAHDVREAGGYRAETRAGREAAAGRAARDVRKTDDGKREKQTLSVTERMEEFMFLGLRLTAGVSAAKFRRQFGVGIREVYGSILDGLERDGLLVFYEDGKKMKLTPKGVDVSNYVLAQFLLDEE